MVTSRREWIPHQSRGVVGTVRKFEVAIKNIQDRDPALPGIVQDRDPALPGKPSNTVESIRTNLSIGVRNNVTGYHLPKFKNEFREKNSKPRANRERGEESTTKRLTTPRLVC